MNNAIPDSGFMRLAQILGNPKADPPIPPVIPVSKSTWWAGVKSGRFPKPVRPFGPRLTLWRVDDIRALCEGTDAPDSSINRPERSENDVLSAERDVFDV